MLFAALEAKNTNNPIGWNTVAIAGLDGYAKAKATFTPMPFPYVGCAGPVLPASAHVAAGKVYYADGTGVIWSLAPGGSPAQVTSFPLTSSQQMLSFAVSPDGARLLATIFTLPPKPAGASDPCTSGAPPFGSQHFSLDVYAASAGGASHLLYHQDLGVFGSPPQMQLLSFIGWDAVGPLATEPTGWASQGGGPVHYFGTPVRVDSVTGMVVEPVDGSCPPWDIAPTGDYVCVASGGLSVRRPNGTEIWGVAAAQNNSLEYDLLSTDERRVADLQGVVYSRDQPATSIPSGFYYAGWLDSTTLISGNLGTNLSYWNIDASAPVDLGFKGVFVGTVHA